MKTDRILTIIFLILAGLVLIFASFFLKDNYDWFMYSLCILANILAIARSYNLENYLRQKDTLPSIGLINHIEGLLRNRKKIIGLVVMIRPIFKDDEFLTEKRIINRLTITLYLIIVLMIFISIKMN